MSQVPRLNGRTDTVSEKRAGTLALCIAAVYFSAVKRFLIFMPIILGLAVLGAAELDDGWLNMKRVTRDRPYAVLLRNSHCIRGGLLRVSEDALVLQIQPGRELVIERSQVLAVADYSHYSPNDYALVFSGRSSWSDVKDVGLRGSEYLSVITKHSQQQRWSNPTVSDDSITGEGRAISKTDVRFVYYYRFKPLTLEEEYLDLERADLFAPRLWFHGALLGKIAVLLYDSTVQEDNSPTFGKTACGP